MSTIQTSLGLTIIEHLHAATVISDETSNKYAVAAADAFVKTLALVQPATAVEALAAAILIGDDLITARDDPNERASEAAMVRIEQRATMLAAWIERTHNLDRDNFGLSYFMGKDDIKRLLPHTVRQSKDCVRVPV